MKYELWDIVNDGVGLQPLTKLFESDDFMKVFIKFEYQYLDQNRSCAIIANKQPISDEYKTDEKIYESPDSGKTIFERTVLNSERKQIT
jgi:hypothetical protein